MDFFIFHYGFSLSFGSLTFTAKTNNGGRKFSDEGMIMQFEIHTFDTTSFHSVKSESGYLYPSRSWFSFPTPPPPQPPPIDFPSQPHLLLHLLLTFLFFFSKFDLFFRMDLFSNLVFFTKFDFFLKKVIFSKIVFFPNFSFFKIWLFFKKKTFVQNVTFFSKFDFLFIF